MSSPIYFDFLGAVWDQLPENDRERFGELWEGYEQVLAAIYQKYAEINLNIAVSDLQPWTTERWLPYTFDDKNFIKRPATVTSSQDLSMGVNLLSKYMLRIKIDKGAPLEFSVQGANPQRTVIDEIVNKINDIVGYKFAKAIFDNTIIQLTSPTSGEHSAITILPTTVPSLNACEFVLGVDPDVLPAVYPTFRYPYTIPYSRVSSIPEISDKIRGESVETLLVEGTDYIVESGGVVNFKTPPPHAMWAERSQVDEENPWSNYGFLTNIYQPNSPRYVGVIQGLWFALWNGPKPANIRIALYLLFGLPTAPEDGTVTVSDATKIVILGDSGNVFTFTIPSGLVSEVTVGARVSKFQPLVDGIVVFDKINNPGFIKREIGREGIGRFMTENATLGPGDTDETKALSMLEEYTFLPQISVESFIYPDINLGNIKIFLDAFRPLNKTYLFQVIIGVFRDLIGLNDRLSALVDIDLTSNLDANETTFLDQATLDSYETTDYAALNLDPHGIVFDEQLEIEVRSFGVLIDSFIA